MWGTLRHCCGQGRPPKYLKCPIAEVPDLAIPASGRQLDPVTSRSPLQTIFFCNSVLQWGCRVYCWRRLFPACLGLFICTLWAIDKRSHNRELAAEQDVAVPEVMGYSLQVWGEYPVTPGKSLWWAKHGWAPVQEEAGVPSVLTLCTAQSRLCLLPLWLSQAANATCCWSLMSETLPSVA